MNDETGYVMFKGKKHTMVIYDPKEKLWTMRVTNNPEVYATSASIFQNLLMGGLIFLQIEHNVYIHIISYHKLRAPGVGNP